MNAANPGTVTDCSGVPNHRANHDTETAASLSSVARLRVPELAGGADVLSAALAYAEGGWFVGPLARASKNPGSVLGKGWPTMTSRDPGVIVGWFAGTDHDVFLHVGRSGALVVDVDDPGAVPEAFWSAAELAGCPMQRTRKTGDARRAHYLFAQPAGASFGNGRGGLSGCDVRGGNGVIVAQPSAHQHADGLYAWARHGAVPELPAELVALLAPRPAPSAVTAAADGVPYADLSAGAQRARKAYLARARGRELARLDRCTELSTPDGHGYTGKPWDETTHEVACALLDLADTPGLPYSAEEAEADLLGHAPSDAGFGVADHQAKLASAYVRASAGIGRVLPALLDSLDDWDLPTRDGATPGPPMVDGKIIPAPRLSVVRLVDVVPERVSWLWRGRIPAGKLVTLDGDPGLGKSTLALEFAATVTTGGTWPDGSVCAYPGDVILLTAEDGLADTVRPRLDAAGADCTRVHAVQGVRMADGSLRPPTLADVDELRELVVQTGARLLIVDVLMAYLPSGVDSHKDQDIRRVLSRLSSLAEDTGCTVLTLRHLNKAKGGDPMYRGGGSIGIVGAARAGMLVARDPDDDNVRVLASTKSNLGPEPEALRYQLVDADSLGVARVQWLGVSTHSARELLAEHDAREDSPESDEATAWLEDYLTEQGRALSADVKNAARKERIAERTLQRAALDLKVTYVAEGFPRKTYWTLPHSGATGGLTGPVSQTVARLDNLGATGADQGEQNGSGAVETQSRQSRQGSETRRDCTSCGQELLLVVAGRDVCAACTGGGRL